MPAPRCLTSRNLGGAMLLRDHYLRAFSNVNSLEKLANSDGYKMVVSYDSVLKEILSPTDDLTKLDTDKPAWNEFEMCSTVGQLNKALNQRGRQNTLSFSMPSR